MTAEERAENVCVEWEERDQRLAPLIESAILAAVREAYEDATKLVADLADFNSYMNAQTESNRRWGNQVIEAGVKAFRARMKEVCK